LRKEIAHLRTLLASLESKDNDVQDSIAELSDMLSRIIRREIEALGVLESLPKG